MPNDASIAVIVMAINGDRRAADAVASLRAQDVPVEIVVVNTGEGSLAQVLAESREHIVLAEADGLRLPGGTRNVGIAQSRAGIVAFLAADCLATAGWARLRLSAHASGAPAVASALRPAPGPDGEVSTASWASYALLHSRRFPECPADQAAKYGASYARSLFHLHGVFREDLRTGEDTEFHARLSASAASLHWAPDVVTLHHYPPTLGAALRDTFFRGRSLHAWQRAHAAWPLRAALSRAVGSWVAARKLTRYTIGETRQALERAAPATALLSVSYASGAIVGSLAAVVRMRSGRNGQRMTRERSNS